MPTKCPNKNLAEWKSLQSDLGSYALAMQAYELNGEEIPTTARAKELLLANRSSYETNGAIVKKENADDSVQITITPTDGRHGKLFGKTGIYYDNEVYTKEPAYTLLSWHAYNNEDLLGGIKATEEHKGKGTGTILLNAFIQDAINNGVRKLSILGPSHDTQNVMKRYVEKGILSPIEGSKFVSPKGEPYPYFGFEILKSPIQPRAQIVGEKAQLNQDVRDNLAVARSMEKAGKTSTEIAYSTGWERGADGFWRYEIADIKLKTPKLTDGYSIKVDDNYVQKHRIIDDSTGLVVSAGETEAQALKSFQRKLITKATKLTDIIDENSEVFKAYPQLKDIKFKSGLYINALGAKGWFEPETNTIGIQSSVDIENDGRDHYNPDLRIILIHEIQHAIQEIEGFAKGGEQAMFDSSVTKTKREGAEHIKSEIERQYENEMSREIILEFPETYSYEELKQFYNSIADKFDVTSNVVSQTAGYLHELIGDTPTMENYKKRMLELNSAIFNATPYNQYHKLAGEVEARNAMNRARTGNYTTEISQTEDVDRKDQTLYFGNGKLFNSSGQGIGDVLVENSGVSAMRITNVTTHTSFSKMKSNPNYDKAKAGDREAAARLINEVVNDDKIKALSKYAGAVVVPVIAIEKTGNNAIPLALAAKLEEEGTGLIVDTSIVQTNRPEHSGAKNAWRLVSTPTFAGEVQQGKKYVLVDDAVSSGSTLKALQDYIEDNGGDVVAITTVTAGRSGTRFSITNATKQNLIAKFGEELLTKFLKDYGIADTIDDLTESQATRIKAYASLDRIGNAIFKELGERVVRDDAPTKATPRPISESSAKFLQIIISAVFPGVTVKFLTQQEYNEKFGNDTNAVVGTDGVVYFNSAKVNATTQVHEFGHVWSSWAKRFAPKLYQQGLALAKADTALMERVGKLYPSLTGDALAEEALATMIGEQGGKMLEQHLDENGNIEQQGFLRRLWEGIRAFMLKNFGVKLGEDFYGDTIGQFSATVASKLISGDKISAFTSEDIANIEQDLGIARAQVAYENTYKNDFFVNDTGIASTPIQEASWQDNAMWLQQDLFEEVNKAVLKAVAKNPDITTGDIVDSGEAANIIRSWFGKTINEIEETVTNRGLHTGKTDENPMNKASDKELVQAKATNSAGGYDADFATIAQQLFLDQNFDRQTLPQSARNLWDKMVKFRQRQQYLALNSDSLFVSDTEKVAVDDASNIVQEQITKWMDKVNKYKTNKFSTWVIEKLEWYMMKVANMRLWVQLQTGMKSGPLWELMKGMHRGSATANYVRFVAQDMLQPLYKADWLKGGSQTLNKTAKLSELETEDFGGTIDAMTGERIGGVPITTEEQFNIFMVLQQKQVRGALMGSAENPKEAKFYVQEFKGERNGQVVKISYEDYQRLLEKFDSHWDEVNGSWGSAARYIFGQVQDTFKLENGVLLGSTIHEGEEDEKWNIYFPLIHGEGKDAIQTFMKSNSFVNDIASHKMRSPSSEEVYYAGGALGTAEAYIDDNAQYIGFAMPVRNMNLFMKKNEQFFKDNKMQEYVEWWNFTRETIFNPKQSILGSTEQVILEGFVISRLGLNPFVFLKQFTSIPLASTVIPSKYLTASSKELFGTLTAELKNYDVFSEWMGKDKALISVLEEMKQHSPYALSRLTHGVNEMEKHILAHENYFTKYFEKATGKKIQMDDFMKWIRSADNATGAMMWSAAKKMVSADMGLTEGTPEYWRAVDEKYTDAVIESQSSIDEINRPKYPKEGTLFAKSLSLFAGQTFSNFNALAGRIIEFMNDPSPKNRMKMYQSFMNVIVINALMVAAVDTLRSGVIGVEPPDKDELDIFGEKFTRAMYQNIPIIAPIVDAAVSKYQNPVFGRDFGYPIFEVVNDGATAMAHAMKGKDEKAIQEMVYFAAGIYGIPLTPIRTGQKILE